MTLRLPSTVSEDVVRKPQGAGAPLTLAQIRRRIDALEQELDTRTWA